MRIKIILFCFLLLANIIYCQTGNIKGKVVDSKTKQPLIGANVMVIGQNFGAATNDEGYFLIKDVPENIYKISVKYIGYHEHIEADIRVIRRKTFFTPEIELVESSLVSEEVVVSTGSFNDSFDAPVSNYSFTKDEIVRAPGAGGDVFRAIDNLPGVSTSGGEFSAFSVRGSGPKDNIILVDNIPFGRLSHFNEASGSEEVEGGRFSIFTTGLIEKATFQGGGFSSKYGGKFSSFLDLTLKEGNKESYKIDASYDLLGWEVNYDGKAFIMDNSSFRLSARSYDFKNVFNLIDEIGQGHITMSDYVGKFTTDINSSNKLSILGIYSTETSLRNVGHIYDGEAYDDRSLRDEAEDKYLAGINWRFLPDKKSFLTTSLYYNKTDMDQKEGRAYTELVNGLRPSKDEVHVRFPIGEYYAKQNALGIKSDYSYNFDNGFTFSTGLNIQSIDYDSKILMNGKDTLYVFDEDELESAGIKYLIIEPEEIKNNFNKKRMEYAGYAELSIPVSNRLRLNAGARYEYNDLSENSDISPRISGTFRLTPKMSLNFAMGLYYQIPEMLLLSGHNKNEKLKNEKAFHYILGITRYIGNDMKFIVEGYYKNMDDLIMRHNSNNAIAANSGRGYAYGLDLSLIKRFVTQLYGQVNYSYGVSKIKEKPNESYYNSTFNQPHIFNILVGYQMNDNWSFTAKWKYATGRPNDKYVIYADVHNDPQKLRYSKSTIQKNSERFSAFHSLNLRVDYRVQISNYFALTAFLDFMNIYGNDNFYTEGFQETTGKVEGEGLQFLPTFGFKLEF